MRVILNLFQDRMAYHLSSKKIKINLHSKLELHNIALEKHNKMLNLSNNIMKRTIIMIVIAILVIATVVLWIVNADFQWNVQEVLMISGLVIVVGFALYLAVLRLRSSTRQEAPEDELSKKIMTKTSSLSFYISLYWWLVLSYFSDRIDLETSTIIGAGILGMAIIFFLSWVGVKIFGLRNG